MSDRHIAPYGSWKSPITSDLIIKESVSFSELSIHGEDLYWIEMRPSKGGSYALVRRSADGAIADVIPDSFNVRTRVHEYGGGAYCVGEGGIYFSNFDDQRLYRQQGDQSPVAITPVAEYYFADGEVDRENDRLVCIREDHSPKDREAINTLVSKSLASDDAGEVIASGCDFYAAPRISPAGTKLAWLQWNHPNMPWDGMELCLADRNSDGSLGEIHIVAGGPDEAVQQPCWSPDGTLYFISDRSGWWNLYRWVDGKVETLCEMEAEFGGPMWRLGMSTFGFASAESLWCTYSASGGQKLARLDTRTLELNATATPYSSHGNLRVGSDFAAFIGGSPSKPSAIVRLDLRTNQFEELRRASSTNVDDGYLSAPRSIEFPTENERTAHAYYYAPANCDFAAPSSERPPLLVKSHGGPTSATSSDFNLSIQYWTSRGFAVLDVNYGGSTGYGREFRERLRGQWGVVDVDDCVNGALYLVREGLADVDRLAIDGGSAGGYTTINALTFRDVFKAGASYFGISDLTVFLGDTHKFESRYLDSLIGPYPERADLYTERSALNFVDQLSCPIIFFQGDEDKIVPPNQAEIMVEALKRKGLPVAYLLFEGEQHGFRKAANIKRALDGEFYFYSRVFGFDPADEIEPVEIMNL